MSTRYLSVTETAKLIRKKLAQVFPGQKFSVRSEKYAGGASIDIDWTDGPTRKEVDEVVYVYRGSGFDGMIDLKYYKTQWLMPDGFTLVPASSQGSTGSLGADSPYSLPKPHPQAEAVHSGADHVSTHRSLSLEFFQRGMAEFERKHGFPAPVLNVKMLSHFDGSLYLSYQQNHDVEEVFWYEFINEILGGTSAYTPPTQAESKPAPNVTADAGAVEISKDRDWTWVKFSAKPAPSILEQLKGMGARFSGKRVAWYFTQPVEEATLRALVCA